MKRFALVLLAICMVLSLVSCDMLFGPCSSGHDYEESIITEATCADEGAVFLPVTGYRNYKDSQVNLFDYNQSTGAGGFYWTSIIYGRVKARCVRFTASELVIELGKDRILGYSIRLARKGRAF